MRVNYLPWRSVFEKGTLQVTVINNFMRFYQAVEKFSHVYCRWGICSFRKRHMLSLPTAPTNISLRAYHPNSLILPVSQWLHRHASPASRWIPCLNVYEKQYTWEKTWCEWVHIQEGPTMIQWCFQKDAHPSTEESHVLAHSLQKWKKPQIPTVSPLQC